MKWSEEIQYESEPIGGGNPYYRCTSCKQSDPYVSIEGHRAHCEFRLIQPFRAELDSLLTELRVALGGMGWLPKFLAPSSLADAQRYLAALMEARGLLNAAVSTEDTVAAQELAYEHLQRTII